jgi:hypothetical protein
MDTKNPVYAKTHPLLPDLMEHLHQHGHDQMAETMNHVEQFGMSGGIAGFVYDEDCRAFLARPGVLEKARLLVRDYADGIGDPLLEVAARLARHSYRTDITQEDELAGARMMVLDVGGMDGHEVARLAWFAAERVAYAVSDARDDGALNGTPLGEEDER